MRLSIYLIVGVLAMIAYPSIVRAAPNNEAVVEHRPWLGVSIAQSYRGVRVDEVIPDTPADIAGIRVGDLIVGVSGVDTATPTELSDQVGNYSIGDQVIVRLWRYGSPSRKEYRIPLVLSEILDDSELFQRRLVDKKASNFRLRRRDKPKASSEEFAALRGKVVVLVFLSPSCGQCRAGFRRLASLQAEESRDLVVLGLSEASAEESQRFFGAGSSGITLVDDPQSMVRSKYRCEQEPCVVVVGKDGIVVHADSGDKIAWDDVVLTAKRGLRARSPFL